MPPGCSICCNDCSFTSTPRRTDNAADPFAQRHMLAAGAVAISTTHIRVICNHLHVEGDWHPFELTSLLPLIKSAEDESTLRSLDFLVKHQFISVTIRQASSLDIVYFRIFLIPWDLANVQGRLLRRDEATILSPARKFLRNLLPRISRCPDMWMARPSMGKFKMLIPLDVVCS